jgi:hypothetical protein
LGSVARGYFSRKTRAFKAAESEHHKFVRNKAASTKPKVATFRDWLLAEAADDTRRLRKIFGSK